MIDNLVSKTEDVFVKKKIFLLKKILVSHSVVLSITPFMSYQHRTVVLMNFDK